MLFRSEPDAGNEVCATDLATIRALNQPLVLALVESGPIDVLVVGDMLTHVPLLLDVVEISSEFRTSSVALLECKVFP